LGLPSPPSFSLFLKAGIWIILGSFFLDIIFNLNLEKIVPTIFLGRRKMISLNRWWKEGE
jgi:hypothetical protein